MVSARTLEAGTNSFAADKSHTHMNSTRWPSLTEFAKHLGREGTCRVEETEKGLHIAWIDNSPEALRRQDALRKKEKMERGDEERENQLIQEQIQRAKQEVNAHNEEDEEKRMLQRGEGEKIKLSFGTRTTPEKLPTPPHTSEGENPADGRKDMGIPVETLQTSTPPAEDSSRSPLVQAPAIKISAGVMANKPKNVFAAQKKSFGKKLAPSEQPKRTSVAERIMKEDLERKRGQETQRFDVSNTKRQRLN